MARRRINYCLQNNRLFFIILNDNFVDMPSNASEESGSGSKKTESLSDNGEKELCRALLQSNDPSRHAEAFDLCRKNIDTLWGRLWLFKMYFNGVGTARDVKAALHTLNSGKFVVRTRVVSNM